MKHSKFTISNFSAPLSLVAIIGMALSFGPTAGATLITWQTPVAVNINDATQVATNGTLVFAADNWAPYTVNGVSFLTPILADNLSGGVAGPFGPNTTTYAQMLSSGVYRGTGGTSTITNITSLTIGRQYEVQIFTPFWDNSYNTKFSDGANSVNMGNTFSVPTYVIGTFTADATTKNISFDAAAGSPFGLLSAYQLRDITIPEPSTFVLLGMGGLFLWRRVRRNRQ